MNGYADTRWWTGVRDPAHPLGRSAHASVAHGRYIYIINGYTSTDSGMCLFERAGLARYDPLTGSVCFLPVHWDYASVQRYGFSLPLLNTSGMTVALQPETTHEPCYIYIFAGFSLLESFHTNALVRIRLPRVAQNHTSVEQSNQSDPHVICCHAEVIGGHGLLSYVLSLSPRTLVIEAVALTALRAIQRRWSRVTSWHTQPSKSHHYEPSPRDKLCMEYWDGRLYAFGGYGPRFTPHHQWPSQWLCWPFLHDPTDPHEWFPCELDRGWNRQLLVFDLRERSWSLVDRTRMGGAQVPSARAAHQSVLYDSYGWLFIFGGRGPPVPPGAGSSSPYGAATPRDYELHESGRLNDLYCLNLRLLEWTRVLTPLDLPNPDSYLSSEPVWPTGRSWMGMGLAHLSTTDSYHAANPLGCLSQSDSSDWHKVRPLFRLCIVGGFSNTNDALSDAWLIQVSKCSTHGLEARVMATSGAGDRPTPTYQTRQPPTMLVDGFKCPASEGYAEPTSILVMERTGLHNHYTISDTEMENSADPMVEEDIAFHVQIYNQATFTPKQQSTRQSVSQQLKPSRPFHRIARSHTNLIMFLLTHFSVHQPCESADETRLSETEHAQRRADLEQTCSRLVDTLRPAIQIVSFLIRILVKFMLPWEPLCMLLRETDAWLPRSTQVKLVDQLSSGYAAQKSSTLHLALSNQALLDKFALLLPLDKVRIPAPYHGHSLNANDQLSYHIQHTVLSFILWSGASPLNQTVQEWSEPLPVVGERVDSYARDPLARFWHSVTFVPIEGSFYVIGGATAAAMQHPVECYGLLEPSTLFDLCLKRLAVLILRASAYQPQPAGRSVDVTTGSQRPVCVLHQPHCNCDLCGYLNGTLTEDVKHKLIQWLL